MVNGASWIPYELVIAGQEAYTIDLRVEFPRKTTSLNMSFGNWNFHCQWAVEREKIWIMSRSGGWPGELCVNLSILWESMCTFCMMLSRITHWMDMYALSMKVSRIIHWMAMYALCMKVSRLIHWVAMCGLYLTVSRISHWEAWCSWTFSLGLLTPQ